MTPNIELTKTRDFGEIITDTLLFIRQNLKPLLKCVLVFCGFFIVAGIFLGILQQSKMLNFMNSSFPSPGGRVPVNSPFDFIGVEYFALLFILFLNYTSMHVTVLAYISLYKEKGNIPPTVQEVWGYFKYFYFKILGSSIVVSLLLMVASMLCLAPGVYLFPILAFVYPIMIFENTTFGYAFNRSFKLIKENWWLTFGTFLVIGLIMYVAVLVIIMPLTIINMGSMFVHPEKGFHLSTTITFITTALENLCQLFFIIPLVAVALCYFNLTEKIENTGLLSRINHLGTTNNDSNLPAEEY